MSNFSNRGSWNVVRSMVRYSAAFFAGAIFSSASGNADDVPWLKAVTSAPVIPVVENLGKVETLLQDADGKPITTIQEWEKHRQTIRDQWIQFLGPMPEPRPAVALEILKTESLPTITRQLVRYEGEPGIFVAGYLLIPKAAVGSKAKYPAVLAMHPTTNATIDDIAGISGQDTKQFGLALAQRGFIVFCPRCFLWQDVNSLNEAVEKHRERHPKTTGMAKMLYDAVRAAAPGWNCVPA